MALAALGRTGEGLAWASAAALAAMIWPPAAIFMLAFLAARALGASPRLPRLINVAAPIGAAFAVGAVLGLAAGVGVLFVWRVVEDTRWSLREDARLAAIGGGARALLERAHLVLVPIFALSMVAYTAPHMVAGLPLDLPHVPLWAPLICGGLAAVALFDWAIRCAAEARLSTLAPAPAAHQLAHHAIFLLAYASAQDISAGLMAFIAWRLAHAAPRRAQPSLTAVP